jgi:hypothetical protein
MPPGEIPSGRSYSKTPRRSQQSILNKILTECSWGDPGRLNSITKTPGRFQWSTLH